MSKNQENIENIKRLFIYAAPLAIILIIFLTIYAVDQQTLRQSANDPQIQLAEDGATQLEAGTAPASVIPTQTVELESSLAPYVIIFDQYGKPIASSASLEGTVPIPPQGIFENTKNFGEERLTWEPKSGVREAVVIKRIDGNNPGFILAGRSLREVEERESFLSASVFVALIGSMVLALLGMFLHYKIKKN